MILLEGLAVGVAEGGRELVVGVGEVVAKGLSGEVEASVTFVNYGGGGALGSGRAWLVVPY